MHRAFSVLFLVAFAVQVPFSWFLWSSYSAKTSADPTGLIVVSGYILPVVIVALLWFAYALYDSIVLGLICWFGMFIVVAKAITILIVIIGLLPIATLYSSLFMQTIWPGIALIAVLYPKRRTLQLEKYSLIATLIGAVALAAMLTYVDVLVLFVTLL